MKEKTKLNRSCSIGHKKKRAGKDMIFMVILGLLLFITTSFLFSQTEYSLLTNITPTGQGNDGPYELGMKFTSSQEGQVTAIRFYKIAGESGTHVGKIWSESGTQLASVTFSGETSSGWQEATLSSPLSIDANTGYVVSYNVAANFARTEQGLASAITNGPLSTIVGNNGVYSSTPNSFPTSTYINCNWFADIAFVTGDGTGDTLAPSVPSGLSTSNVTQNSFTLSWTASTDDVGVTGYEVFLDGTSVGTTTGTSISVTGLNCESPYTITVRARDAVPNWSDQSSPLNVTTSGCTDTQPPSVPTGLSSSSITETSFTLTWTASTDNVGVTGYEVLLDGTSYGTTASTSIDISGLDSTTTYSMAVMAGDAAGNWSALSTSLNVTTLGQVDDVYLSDIPWVSATIGWGSIGLDMCVSDLAPITINGTVYNKGIGSHANSEIIYDLSTGNYQTFICDAGIDDISSCGDGVIFEVHNENGLQFSSGIITSNQIVPINLDISSWSTLILIIGQNQNISCDNADWADARLTTSIATDVEPPSIPNGLNAVNITQTSFTLNWNASTDNVGVTGYEVYLDGILLDTRTTTSMDINGLAGSTTFSMTVRAGDIAGNWSVQSVPLNVTTLDPVIDTEPPSIPSGLSASGIGSSSFTLTWAASTDNIEVTSYEVFQDGSSRGTTSNTSMLITGLTELTTFEMTVRAGDAAGNWSEQSIAADVTTLDGSSNTVTVDKNIQYQKIEGFGGFGGRYHNWGNVDPLYDNAFVDLIIEDLGATIVRTELCGNMETYNDNSDPYNTDLSAFNLDIHYGEYQEQTQLRPWLNYVNALKTKANSLGEPLEIITSIWSPPYWMKYLESYMGPDPIWNRVSNGVGPEPGIIGAKEDMYPEYAEYLYAYTQIFKQETGLNLYALSFANEPAFAQGYPSCVWSAEQYREMLKKIDSIFNANNVDVRLFGQEDVQALDRILQYINTSGDDMVSRHALDIFAVHGYSTDGTSTGGSISNWLATQAEASKYNYPLWMTETSGYPNTYTGALDLANDIHIALYYGKISAWVFWTFNDDLSSNYNLIADGVPTKRYYTSKNFYKYIRPGAVMIDAVSSDPEINVTAFSHLADQTMTFVLINNSTLSKTISLGVNGSNIPTSFEIYRTSSSEDCANVGTVTDLSSISLPAQSVTTLYGVQSLQDAGLAPVIINQPQDITVPLAGRATFSIEVNGSPDLTFQWYRNGVLIPGETGRTYIIKTVETFDDGANYSVEVTNEYGNTTSAQATLTVSSFSGLLIYKASTAPIIDGVMDTLWENIPTVNLSQDVIGTSGTPDFGGNFKIAYDNANLYMYVSITDDSTMNNDSTNVDAFELFFDTDNSKSLSYGLDDYQFQFPYNRTTFNEWKHSATDGVVYANTVVPGGWAGEVSIPWSTIDLSPVDNHIVGIDVAADDADGNGRETKIAWNTNNNDIWFNPSYMGTGLLSAELKSIAMESGNLFKPNKNILIYPNPIDEGTNLNISFIDNVFASKASLTIFDMNGKQVLITSIEPGEHTLQLKELKKGVYILKMDMNDIQHFEKLIIK